MAGGGLTDEQMAGAPAPKMHINREKLMALREKTRKAAEDAPSHLSLDEAGHAFAGPGLSMADTATFGGFGALLRAMANKSPSNFERQVGGNALRSMEDYRGEHPVVSRYTDLPGYFMKPAQAVAETAAGATDNALRLIPGLEQTLPRSTQLVKGMVSAGATNAVASGANAAFEGGDIPRAVREGAQNGIALATPLGIMANLASGTGRAIQQSKGGQAREFLERHGVEVGPSSPGRGGPMESMVTQGTSDADIGHQAEVSAKTGLDMLNQEKRAVLGILGRRIGAIEEGGGGATLRDVSDIVRQMREATAELDTAPHARGALTDLLNSVTSKQGQHFTPDVDPYLLSETDVNKLRRQLDRYAKTGQSTDAALSPLKGAARETRGVVAEGPYAETNADYAAASKKYQESRRLLGINERPRTPEESQAAVNKVKNLITRRGQNTVTAGGQEERLAEFEQRHPEIAQELSRPEILRKRADISFHLLPTHGGLLDRMTGGHHGLAAAFGLGAGGLTGALPALTLTNLPAIQARLLYGPALTMQAAEPLLLNSIPQATEAGNREARR